MQCARLKQRRALCLEEPAWMPRGTENEDSEIQFVLESSCPVLKKQRLRLWAVALRAHRLLRQRCSADAPCLSQSDGNAPAKCRSRPSAIPFAECIFGMRQKHRA